MKKYFYILVVAMLTTGYALAQANTTTMMIHSEVRIDSIGNALFDVSGKLTAQQWIRWNYMFGGGNASNVKRSIERSLSPYYVYDFKYVPNEMDRSFTIQYKAKGVVEYLGKDKWVASVGLREAQPVKLTENTFSCVVSELGDNAIIQNNMKITLPASAGSMDFDKDEFNNVLVRYKMPTEYRVTFGSEKMKATGYSLLGLGVLSLLVIVVFRKKIAR